jgi:hypothetical protein
MNHSYRALAVVCLALAFAAPAAAQTKKELVNRILLLQQPGIEAMARSLAERPAIQLAAAARQVMPSVPADKREAVVKAIDADIKRYTDEAVPLLRERAIKLAPSTLGAELETNFNEDELKQLIGWFESPVVKRYQSLMPNLERGLAEKLISDTRNQIEPKLKVLETAMAKNLGLPPPGAAPAGGAAAPAGGGAPMPGNRGGDAPRK